MDTMVIRIFINHSFNSMEKRSLNIPQNICFLFSIEEQIEYWKYIGYWTFILEWTTSLTWDFVVYSLSKFAMPVFKRDVVLCTVFHCQF